MDTFEEYAQKLRDAKPNLSQDQQKVVYGLFKQAKMGDVTEARPGMLSGWTAQGKWDSWDAQKGKS